MDNKKMIPDIGEVNVVESFLSGKMKVFVICKWQGAC